MCVRRHTWSELIACATSLFKKPWKADIKHISFLPEMILIRSKSKSFRFQNTKKKPWILIFRYHDWMQNPECWFNILRAFTSSPWESLVCCWVPIGRSTGRVRFGWCRSRTAWCSGPSAAMGWAEWVKGEGSGSADLWRWIWATRSSGRRDRPPAWRRSWGRGPPAGNRTQQIMSWKDILLCKK